jgi:zinc protease
MTLRLFTTVFLALSLMLPAPAAAARAKDELRRQTLPNGLTLILAPDSRAGGVDVSVWYRAGTRWEKAGKTGLTHVVEQLMFRSAPREGQDDYIQRVRRAGGTVGAESTPDYSSFFQTIPPEALELVFEMEARSARPTGARTAGPIRTTNSTRRAVRGSSGSRISSARTCPFRCGTSSRAASELRRT